MHLRNYLTDLHLQYVMVQTYYIKYFRQAGWQIRSGSEVSIALVRINRVNRAGIKRHGDSLSPCESRIEPCAQACREPVGSKLGTQGPPRGQAVQAKTP